MYRKKGVYKEIWIFKIISFLYIFDLLLAMESPNLIIDLLREDFPERFDVVEGASLDAFFGLSRPESDLDVVPQTFDPSLVFGQLGQGATDNVEQAFKVPSVFSQIINRPDLGRNEFEGVNFLKSAPSWIITDLERVQEDPGEKSAPLPSIQGDKWYESSIFDSDHMDSEQWFTEPVQNEDWNTWDDPMSAEAEDFDPNDETLEIEELTIEDVNNNNQQAPMEQPSSITSPLATPEPSNENYTWQPQTNFCSQSEIPNWETDLGMSLEQAVVQLGMQEGLLGQPEQARETDQSIRQNDQGHPKAIFRNALISCKPSAKGKRGKSNSTQNQVELEVEEIEEIQQFEDYDLIEPLELPGPLVGPFALSASTSTGILASQRPHIPIPRTTTRFKGSKNPIPPKEVLTYDMGHRYISVDKSSYVNMAHAPFFPHIKDYAILKRVPGEQYQSSARITRVRYFRGDIQQFQQDHGNYHYQTLERYDRSHIYNPESIRVQLDFSQPNGKGSFLPFNDTRQGLCPYCPHLAFFDLKTTAYGQHLAYHHGVYPDGFLVPDPLYYGNYILKKTGTERKTIAHERLTKGVMCPACFEIFEVGVSKTTATVQPFYNYLRHFKETHRKSKQKHCEGFFDAVCEEYDHCLT